MKIQKSLFPSEVTRCQKRPQLGTGTTLNRNVPHSLQIKRKPERSRKSAHAEQPHSCVLSCFRQVVAGHSPWCGSHSHMNASSAPRQREFVQSMCACSTPIKVLPQLAFDPLGRLVEVVFASTFVCLTLRLRSKKGPLLSTQTSALLDI